MGNGLELSFEEFQKLKNVHQKLDILYKNEEKERVLSVKQFDELKALISGYKSQQKIIWGWLVGITSIGSFLAIKLWSHIAGN